MFLTYPALSLCFSLFPPLLLIGNYRKSEVDFLDFQESNGTGAENLIKAMGKGDPSKNPGKSSKSSWGPPRVFNK